MAAALRRKDHVVGSVDDWYMDRAHRGDQDPTYDPANDDTPDPFAFGEQPQREWVAKPSPGSGRSAVRRRAKSGNKRDGKSESRNARRKKPRQQPRVAPWRAQLRAWLSRNPRATVPESVAALERMGCEKVSIRSVAREMLSIFDEARKTRRRDSGGDDPSPFCGCRNAGLPRPVAMRHWGTGRCGPGCQGVGVRMYHSVKELQRPSSAKRRTHRL